MELSPRYWALATFFIPVASAIGYCVWLVVDESAAATSTRAEEIVRAVVYAVMTAVFLFIRRPWTRAVAVGSAVALVLWLSWIVQFEVFRGR